MRLSRATHRRWIAPCGTQLGECPSPQLPRDQYVPGAEHSIKGRAGDQSLHAFIGKFARRANGETDAIGPLQASQERNWIRRINVTAGHPAQSLGNRILPLLRHESETTNVNMRLRSQDIEPIR